jgi:hypothetical protein
MSDLFNYKISRDSTLEYEINYTHEIFILTFDKFKKKQWNLKFLDRKKMEQSLKLLKL